MLVAVFLVLALAQPASQQADAPAPTAPAPAPATVAAPVQATASSTASVTKLPAGTLVEVEMVDTLSSATSKLSERFKLRLAEPITWQGSEVAPAGAMGEGEVIDVARSGMGGKQGKLIVSARYIELGGRQVRVRGMTFMASGKSRVDLATGVLLIPYAGMAAVLVKGGDIEMPAGARATVRLAEDVELPLAPSPPAIGN